MRRHQLGTQWLLIEIKGGQYAVESYARAATLDLLAYRAAYDETLRGMTTPYGLGIAWGAGLLPSADESIMLCTPDTIREALSYVLG